MTHKETFISWLQDAHAMERGLIEILESHRDQSDGYPDVQKKINEHLDQTKVHADRIGKCLRDLQVEPSGIKSALSGFMGNVTGVANSLHGDRLIKNGIADFAAEHFEIASYSALITAAEDLEYAEIAKVCKEILAEEEEMAAWLQKNLPVAVKTFLEEKRSEEME